MLTKITMNVWIRGALGAAVLWAGCSTAGLRLAPQYVAVHNTLSTMGLAQTGTINQGSLDEGGVVRFPMTVEAGSCHTLLALGASGVSNLDLEVLDDTGTEIVADRTNDAQAAAQFCPESDGDVQVVVRMTAGAGEYIISSWSGGYSSGGGGRVGASQGTCDRPITLRSGTPTQGTTAGASHVHAGTCVRSSTAPERVYRLQVRERSTLRAVITSDYDGVLYLRGECAGANTELACNDDAPSTRRSEILATLEPGDYFLFVDGFGSASGNYELTVETSAIPPVAQVCQQAQSLVAGQAVTGSTAGQPDVFQATCAGGARSPERVYSLEVPQQSRLRVRMQSTYDGALYVRSDCESANSELACNDDFGDTAHSLVTTQVEAGRYFIYVDGFGSGSAGDFSMQADLAPVAGGTAPGDNCSAPVAMAADSTLLQPDTFAAADDFQGSCGGQGGPDVVHQFSLTERSRVTARIVNSSNSIEHPVLYVRRACAQADSEVACLAWTPQANALSADLDPGDYFLIMDSTGAREFGQSSVEMAISALAPLQQACRTAPRIRPGRTIRGDTSSNADRFHASCGANARSGELVYRLVLNRRSRVEITAEQQYDGVLYLRSECLDESTEVACNDDAGDTRHSRLEAVLERGTYYVFADGYANRNQGAFELNVQVSRP